MGFDFYDYLYQGYTGEYQLVSALYRNGLDAVRPPADMGIDVVSLNLKEQLKSNDASPETFFFQVKTFATTIAAEEPGERACSDVFFKLKESELDILCKNGKRALVCYIYNHENDSLVNAYEAPFLCFWIDGRMLAAIREKDALFIQEGDTKFTLRCQLRKSPFAQAHWYAVVVDKSGSLVTEGYLGAVDSNSEATQAADGADHYSIKGYLDYVRSATNDA